MKHQIIFKHNLKEALQVMLFEPTKGNGFMRNLTESETKSISSDLVLSVLRKARSYMMDASIFRDIEKTKGNITKHPDYKDFDESMKVINRIGDKSKTLSNAFADIETCHKFLKDNKKHFEEAYAKENLNLIMFYNTLAVNMLGAGVVLIGYLSQSFNKEEPYLANSIETLGDEVFLSSMFSIAKSIKDGSANIFVSKSLKASDEQGIKESVAIPVIFGFSIGILWYIRDIIYYIYELRYNFSKWLKSYGEFLKLRSYTLAKKNKEVAEKQRAISEKMLDLADTISVETKVASKQVEAKTQSENRAITKTYSNTSGFQI